MLGRVRGCGLWWANEKERGVDGLGVLVAGWDSSGTGDGDSLADDVVFESSEAVLVLLSEEDGDGEEKFLEVENGVSKEVHGLMNGTVSCRNKRRGIDWSNIFSTASLLYCRAGGRHKLERKLQMELALADDQSSWE